MQLRKLIRLLKEAEKKVGPYAYVAIDAKRYENWKMDWTIDDVVSVDVGYFFRWDHENDGPFENGKELPTVVLNQL